MESANWRRMKQLFQDASDMPPHQRETFLKESCPNEPDLIEEVRLMLASQDDASFLERPLANITHIEEEHLAPGKTVGAYQIVRKLGQGGMGAVYLAERNDTCFTHQVAIKVLKRGMDTQELLRRFHKERQILAGLNHPNIAQLFDGGSLADGRPYYVMEYVSGQPITQWCESRNLDLTARLKLFIKVCHVVQFAHENLIVHRDLKPCNILTTADGTPKLLDFGIARMLRDDMDGASIQGLQPMTPDYASPEQILSAPITTSSDIYALGVLLYQLLAGVKPYYLKGLSHLEIRRLVTECWPQPPSMAAIPNTTEPGKTTWKPNWRKSLKGEPDDMVLMALRKDPARRYRSAQQFSEDITRYLEGFPILATRETAAYRTAKFIGRHRLAVSAAALALAILVGFTLVLMNQIRETHTQQLRVMKERDKSNRVVAFLEGVFDNPYGRDGEKITALELLDNAYNTVGWELEELPETRAAMLNTMGRAYTRLDLFQKARPLLEEAHKLSSAGQPQDRIQALVALGELAEKEGDYQRAKSLYNEALLLSPSFFDLDTARIRQSQGQLFLKYSDYDNAECAFMDACQIREKALGSNHPDLAESLQSLAVVSTRKNQADLAEHLHMQAHYIISEAHGARHPKTAVSWRNLAEWELSRANFTDAEAYGQEAVEIFEQTLGPDHMETATTLHLQAMVVGKAGRYSQLPGLMERVLEIRLKVLGPNHPSVAVTEGHLGIVYNKMGQFALAEKQFKSVLKSKEQIFGPESMEIARTLNNMGYSLRSQMKMKEAEMAYHRSVSISHQILGRNHQTFVEGLANLGAFHMDLGEYSEAAFYYGEAVSLHEINNPNHPTLATALSGLGRAHANMDRYEEAEQNLTRAILMQEQQLGPCHPKLSASCHNMGDLYFMLGKIGEAEMYYNRVLQINEAEYGPNHVRTSNILFDLARLYNAKGQVEKAVSLGRKALKIRVGQQDPSHPSVIEAREFMVSLISDNAATESALTLKKNR